MYTLGRPQKSYVHARTGTLCIGMYRQNSPVSFMQRELYAVLLSISYLAIVMLFLVGQLYCFLLQFMFQQCQFLYPST